MSWLPAVLAAWALLSVTLGVAAQPLADGDTVRRLTQAEFAYGDGPAPPEHGWTPVALPDTFVQGGHAADRVGWYRLAFDLPQRPSEPQVLLVQRVVATAQFRLNGALLNAGVRLQPGGALEGPLLTNEPQWMVLPPTLLRAGRNELLVQLAGDPVMPPWISGIAIGPAQDLRGEYLVRDIAQRLVPQALALLMLVSLPIGLRLWWRERHPLQGRMVLTVALWLVLVVLYLYPDLALPRREMQTVVAMLWVAFHWALLGLLWHLAGRPWTWFPRVLAWSSALSMALGLLVLEIEPRRDWLGALMLPTALLRLAVSVMLVQWALRERSWNAVLLTGAELLWLAGPLQTILVVMEVLPPDPFMLTPGSALPLFLVLLWLAAQRLALQREHAAAERETAVLAERQRMMLEMHDGIGAQLATAVRLARRDEVPREQVAGAVQEALDDLRLVIDSLDPGVDRLPPLLGMLRDRIEPRLRALDQRLEWRVDELPVQAPLSPSAALDVLRIVQEALNNALRHAGGSRLSVSLRAVDGGCELNVCDDGAGFDASATAGRGIASMQQRARRLGGLLAIRRGEGRGTVVSLWLPATLGVR